MFPSISSSSGQRAAGSGQQAATLWSSLLMDQEFIRLTFLHLSGVVSALALAFASASLRAHGVNPWTVHVYHRLCNVA